MGNRGGRRAPLGLAPKSVAPPPPPRGWGRRLRSPLVLVGRGRFCGGAVVGMGKWMTAGNGRWTMMWWAASAVLAVKKKILRAGGGTPLPSKGFVFVHGVCRYLLRFGGCTPPARRALILPSSCPLHGPSAGVVDPRWVRCRVGLPGWSPPVGGVSWSLSSAPEFGWPFLLTWSGGADRQRAPPKKEIESSSTRGKAPGGMGGAACSSSGARVVGGPSHTSHPLRPPPRSAPPSQSNNTPHAPLRRSVDKRRPPPQQLKNVKINPVTAPNSTR